MSTFQENLRQELKDSTHWDFAGAGYQSLDAFFIAYAQQQVLAADGRLTSAAEALSYAKNYEVHANAMAKIRARVAPLGTVLSASDAAFVNQLTWQETLARTASQNLRNSAVKGASVEFFSAAMT
jgi:hypothetical protein